MQVHGVIMGFSLHANNSNDPPEVRNWRIHLITVVVSMGAIASKHFKYYEWPIGCLLTDCGSGIRHQCDWRDDGLGFVPA